MTQDELDALPEMSTEWTSRIEEIGGKAVRIPVPPMMVVLWTKDDDPMLIEDRQGRVWTTGWHEGRQWKRRRREYESIEARPAHG